MFLKEKEKKNNKFDEVLNKLENFKLELIEFWKMKQNLDIIIERRKTKKLAKLQNKCRILVKKPKTK